MSGIARDEGQTGMCPVMHRYGVAVQGCGKYLSGISQQSVQHLAIILDSTGESCTTCC